jgi:hypothetical protein
MVVRAFRCQIQDRETANLGGVADETVAEIVQCGEPASKASTYSLLIFSATFVCATFGVTAVSVYANGSTSGRISVGVLQTTVAPKADPSDTNSSRRPEVYACLRPNSRQTIEKIRICISHLASCRAPRVLVSPGKLRL